MADSKGRILLWSEFYPPYRGGLEVMVSDLAHHLATAGWTVLVVTGAGDGLAETETAGGVGIHRFPFQQAIQSASPAQIARLIKAVATLKQAFRPDLVHLHFQGPSCFFQLRTRDAYPAPMIVTIHGGVGNCEAEAGTLLGSLLKAADWVTGVSQAMLAEAIALDRDVKVRSSVVYNGRNPTVGIASPPSLHPEILCFGRHVRDKGFDVAIDALPRLKQFYPEVKLVIASDGPERGPLEAQARRLGLSDTVEFTGWLTEHQLYGRLERAQVVLVPSRWREGFGLVALEAALHSRPVVASAIGGLPEVVIDRVTGLLVEPDNASQLADAILELLDNPTRARLLGRNARTRAERFSLEASCSAYEALYLRLVSGHRGDALRAGA